MTWWPWAVLGLLVGLLIGRVLSLRREVEELRKCAAEEKAAHYVTERRLIERGRGLLVLTARVEAMAEIAQGSAQLAQIYNVLLAELRRPGPT